MSLFGLPSQKNVDMLHSILRQLGYTLVTAICLVSALLIITSLALILTPIVLTMKLRDYCKNFLTRKQ